MPLQIQRTATVYQLDDDTDLQDCFGALAESGWVCSLVCTPDGWSVRLQNNEQRILLTPERADVVVTDGVTVQTMTVEEYNTANPDNQIQDGS